MTTTTDRFVHPEFLMQTDWLAQHLTDPAIVMLDCTVHLIPNPTTTYDVVPGLADFERGHIPGAQFLDLQADLSDPNTKLRFMLPTRVPAPIGASSGCWLSSAAFMRSACPLGRLR